MKGLDVIEILEWANLKKLRALKFYNMKKYDKSFEILAEILSGIEEIDENEEEEVRSIFFTKYPIFFIKYRISFLISQIFSISSLIPL